MVEPRKSKAQSSPRVIMKFEVWVMVQLFCDQELRVQCWSVPPVDCSTFYALPVLLENMNPTDDISGVNTRPAKSTCGCPKRLDCIFEKQSPRKSQKVTMYRATSQDNNYIG